MTDETRDAGKLRRRPRYRGTHPRAFSEKYKEHDPTRFPGERAKILASGKTPAGSHVPVLVAEVLAALEPEPGDVAVDATVGYGGHAGEILKRILPGGRLLALDVDPIELPKAETRLKALAEDLGNPRAVKVVRRNFAGLRKLLAEEELARGADVILADLGVSSMQLDDPGRGGAAGADRSAERCGAAGRERTAPELRRHSPSKKSPSSPNFGRCGCSRARL